MCYTMPMEVNAMSKYTTGEMAKLCSVTVRTVQYYDTRGLLIPSELSEGGRRLYSDDDLRRLRIICFLRELGLPIDSIRDLLAEPDPHAVIDTLLAEQKATLEEELAERQEQLRRLNTLSNEVRRVEHFTVDSIVDIAHIMENKKKLRRMRINMLIVGFLMDAIEVSGLMLGILRGIWWPFAAGMTVVIALGVWISIYYFKRTAYICPRCHTVFISDAKESIFARHTPRTRKLTCTSCGHHGFCIETYRTPKQDKERTHAAH